MHAGCTPEPAACAPEPAAFVPELAASRHSPLPAGDDWSLPENVAWLLKPGRCLGDAPPDSTADLPLEELNQRPDLAASKADAAMVAYSAARQSASQDLGRCVELVTMAPADRSAFFSCALVARGASVSALDPREPRSGSDSAVAVAAETQPECAAAARVSEHEVRLPTGCPTGA